MLSEGAIAKPQLVTSGKEVPIAVLYPPTGTSPFSEANAISLARSYDNSPIWTRTAAVVLADLTIPSSIPPPGDTIPSITIRGVLSWIVVLQSREAFNAANCGLTFRGTKCPPVWVSHLNVAIQANSGRFLRGWFS